MSTSNLPTQNSQLNMTHHLINSGRSSTVNLNNFISVQQTQQHQQLSASSYSEPRHLQIITNGLKKNSFAKTCLSSMEASTGFYGASGHATSPPNLIPAKSIDTILITNDYHHQSNISPEMNQSRFAETVPPTSTNVNKDSTSPPSFHIISKSSKLSVEIEQPTQKASSLNNNNNTNNNKKMQKTLSPAQRFGSTVEVSRKQFQNVVISSGGAELHTDFYSETSAIKDLPTTSEDNNLPLNMNSKQDVSTSIKSAPGIAVNNIKANADSPNLLHEMNICLKNLYSDKNNESMPTQQSSPIKSAVQHKPIVDTTSPLTNDDSFESNVLVIDEPDSTTTATAPHTPPTTPKKPPSLNTLIGGSCHSNFNISTTLLSNELPSTSLGKTIEALNSNSCTTNFNNCIKTASNLSPFKLDKNISVEDNVCNSNNNSNHNSVYSSINISYSEKLPSHHLLTLPTHFSPPRRKLSISHQHSISKNNEKNTWINFDRFSVGEDVLIKRSDNRFYLGTIIEHMFRQYHVRFDDATDIWCRPDEMRKLSISSKNAENYSKGDTRADQPMCIACKHCEPESQVEICERCGRGYHRKCTIETSPGSGQWICKRCDKPLKIFNNHSNKHQDKALCLQLPYNYNLLNWDKKHRVNEEQVYCYCGKKGKFDFNMLQCCRCLNWYHIGCIHSFGAHNKLLRGDAFFVFSCSVCNKGPEFIRRLLMNWADLVHLVLYNLSLAGKHQQKFYSLEKDILPFIFENRDILSLSEKWICLPKEKFKDKIYMTLNKNRDRFVYNRDSQTNKQCFGLRKIVPPIIPEIPVKCSDVLNNDFLQLTLKLQIATNFNQSTTATIPEKYFAKDNFSNSNKSKPKLLKVNTVFNSMDNLRKNCIQSDSSDDEVPIKLIKDKVKKTIDELCTVDDNAIDAVHVKRQQISITSKFSSSLHQKECNLTKNGGTSIQLVEEKSSSETVTSNDGYHEQLQPHFKNDDKNLTLSTMKSKRKRKSFTLGKIYNNHRRVETSSDENSSGSSRGTSLDLIIPPPKNFKGRNNPFRIVTPKKTPVHSTSKAESSGNHKNGYGRNGCKLIKTGVFNTTAFDFAKKLSILKSVGIFSNLNTNNLVKTSGQPRTLRTIKRKLSAKDITIGPNQEVRRRRIRRPSSNIEVISTTTINTLPINYIPIHAKDLLAAAAAATSTTSAANLFHIGKKPSNMCTNMLSDSLTFQIKTNHPLLHGRRLRQRPQKIVSDTSRSSSMSSISSTSAITSFSTVAASADCQTAPTDSPFIHGEDLKETVNKYFGAFNRIQYGEQFTIRAKRQLSNGEMQYLIEWSDVNTNTTNSVHPINPIQVSDVAI